MVIVLKDFVKRQCTYTLEDTFFVSTLKITQDMRSKVEEDLADAFASRLKNPENALEEIRAAAKDDLDEFFKDKAGGRVVYRQYLALAMNLENRLGTLLADGAQKIDTDEILAFLTDKYANKTESQKNVATYDNVENLLLSRGEFSALNIGVSTMMRQENPAANLGFHDITYIEAQIHGPILLDRYVEEIRIDTDEIEEREDRSKGKVAEKRPRPIIDIASDDDEDDVDDESIL